MMNCSRVRDLLPDYSVEMLDARENRAVEAHLAECEECRRELQALEAVVALVEEHGARRPPAGLFNAVRNRIEAGEVTRERPAWWAWLYTRPARFAAMGMAMATVALSLMLPVHAPSIPPNPITPGAIPGSTVFSGSVASSELGSSIRQHAMSAAEGPLADRVAWEAMAQLASQDKNDDDRQE